MSFIVTANNFKDLVCDICEAEGSEKIAVFNYEPSYPATSYPRMLIKGEYEVRHICPACRHKEADTLGNQYAIVQASWNG